MPDRDDALTLIGRRLEKARKIVADGNHSVGPIAQELLDMIDMPEYTKTEPPVMDPNTAAYYRQIIQSECKDAVTYAFAELGSKEVYTVKEMKQAFDRFMAYRQIEGWSTEIVPGRTMSAAKMKGSVVEIGEDRSEKQRGYEQVLDTQLHEIEIHAGRQARGKRLGSGLVEYGLRDYVFFEEAFATVWAALYTGTPKRKGEPFVMAIALAAGYDGLERDFRQSYEALWRLGLVNTYTAKKPLDEQVAKTQNMAWQNAVRIWRGMPTDVPGCIFPKDRAYDNTKVLDYLMPENTGRLSKEDFLRLIQAKYDPTDPRQDAYIRSLTD